MFQPTPLQKLYPHLNFSRVEPPSRSVSQPPKQVVVTPPVVEKPKVIEKVVEKPVPVKTEPVVEKVVEQPVKVSKKTKVVEKQPVKTEPEPEPIKVDKPKVPRPNRLKPEPKPEKARESQIPQKGEKGLQAQYTMEQKKAMYLDRLSRKSVKRAEQEVFKINEVLTSVEHNPKLLAEEEKKVKTRLKLINYAKFFAQDNINETEKRTSTKEKGKDSNGNEPKPSVSVSESGRRGRRTVVETSDDDGSVSESSYGSDGTSDNE
jgi:hypothetical protein